MSEPGKRKAPPPSAVPNAKRKKGGNNGRWTTPHQDKAHQAKGRQDKFETLNVQMGSVEPGDVGIWVTCARTMELHAAREMQMLFEEYGQKMYGIQPPEEVWEKMKAAGKGNGGGDNDDGEAENGDADDDIETLVRKEIASLKTAPASKERIFTRIRFGVDCLLFNKTRPPIDPVALVHRICIDAKRDAEAWAAAAAAEAEVNGGPPLPVARTYRYLNRLTPVTASARANDKGIREMANEVLSPWFKMTPLPDATTTSQDGSEAGDFVLVSPNPEKEDDPVKEKPAYKFAIHASIRHNNELKRMDVINLVAGLIDQNHHKVDLENPDKVILIVVFKSTCGMSVVDGDWDDLRKFNLTELYNLPYKNKTTQDQGAAVTAGEATKAVKDTTDAKDGGRDGDIKGSEKEETVQVEASTETGERVKA